MLRAGVAAAATTRASPLAAVGVARSLVALDLDGTLLTSLKKPCPAAMAFLAHLDQSETIRVIATGRNVSSATRAVQPCATEACPIDYVVAGSGGIVIHWPTQRVVARNVLADAAAPVAAALVRAHMPFFLLKGPPSNHECLFHHPHRPHGITEHGLRDFCRRVEEYKDHARPFSAATFRTMEEAPEGFGQFLLMGVLDVEATKQLIVDSVPADSVRFVTLTSDTGVQWLEVLPAHVSKANGIAQIAALHGVAASACVAMGNDWNDLDMLEWAGTGCVVGNAPNCLKAHLQLQCPHVDILDRTNDEAGVLCGLRRYFRQAIASNDEDGNQHHFVDTAA
jgi:hydroxymethylpyrimidine pyrophosphatase-like HAD family hydrolase